MSIIGVLFGIIVVIGVGFLVMGLIFGSNKHDEDDPDDRIGF